MSETDPDKAAVWSAPPALTRTIFATTGVRLGYSEAFGKPETRQGIIERLQQYSLSEALNYFGRISAVIYNARHPDRSQIQKRLCSGIFGAAAPPLLALLDREQKKTGGQVVFFDEIPIGLGIKFALHALSPERPPTGTKPAALGEAILMLNTLVDKTPLTPRGGSMYTESEWNKWVYFQYVLTASTANDQPLQPLARTYDLFLTNHDLGPDDASDLSLPDLAERATGLPPIKLWSIFWAFLSHFHQIDASNAHNAGAWISRSRFFEKHSFTKEEVDHFFDLVSTNAGSMATEIKKHFSLSDMRPHDLLPLAKSPLIVVGDRVECPYLRLLYDKMTTGLYHILLNAEQGDSPSAKKARREFQKKLGSVYEDYVDRLFRRTIEARASDAPLYIGPSGLRKAVPPVRKGVEPSICDHVLIYNSDTAVLLDTKAKFLPMNVRFGLDEQTFVERATDLFVGAARQLDASIAHIREGKLDSFGFEGSKVVKFYPVVVSLADFPFQPFGYEWLHRKIAAAEYLTSKDVMPLEILSAGDIDALEEAMTKGESLATMLNVKLTSDDWSRHSFHNFMLLGGYAPLTKARSPYLEGIYQQITEEAMVLLHVPAG